MSLKSFAEVIVDIPSSKLDRIFYYRVPQGLQEHLDAGMRVIVPFGSRKVEGFVLGFTENAVVSGIKDIIKIVDMEPVISREILSLTSWMAERYMCRKIDAIRAVIPITSKQGNRFVTALKYPQLFTEQTASSLSSTESLIWIYIKEQGIVGYNELRRRFGKHETRKAVDKLAGMGLVEYISGVKAEIEPRYCTTVKLAVNGEQLDSILPAMENKAPKQAAVLKTLIDKPAITAKEAARLSGTSTATVRELIKKGFIKACLTEVPRIPYDISKYAKTEALKLTGEQARALKEINDAIDRGAPSAFLLHGVTGSGKTEVYLQAISHCLEKGRQAIVLVPEISLTPQMIERFKGRFGSLVAVLHSRLSKGERYDEWRLVKSGKVKIVVGARSAVFAPFSDLGLIIVDEEHETSYKQDDHPKYHARDVALARARLCRGVAVLGSATPSIETYTRAAAGKIKLLKLNKRFGGQPLPAADIIDLRAELQENHRSIFSRHLIEKVNSALERGEQVILFLNRRGYSTFVVCRECGFVLKCPSCNISLTLHSQENILLCHYCGYKRKIPDLCPVCQSRNIRHFGTGTQKIEEEAKKWFPSAKIARMDLDTTVRKGSHEQILNSFKKGETDILIGTQMIAKGLDFPNVSLVGVITADISLNLPDFRAAEKTFQLLTQVAGRAGRGETPGKVIIQTYAPEHFSILTASRHDYQNFYLEEMKYRESLSYPPYFAIIRIVISGNEENSVVSGANALGDILRHVAGGYKLGVEEPVLGPAPAPLSKLRNKYRWHLTLKGRPSRLLRRVLQEALDQLEAGVYPKNITLSIDVDPQGFM